MNNNFNGRHYLNPDILSDAPEELKEDGDNSKEIIEEDVDKKDVYSEEDMAQINENIARMEADQMN